MSIVVQCPNPACRTSYTVAESLLDRNVKCKRCGTRFVARPTLDQKTSDTKPGVPTSSDPFPSLPAEFGRYRVLRLLGRGGMGSVYLAEDTYLGRKVAIKLPSFGPGESTQRAARFVREGRSAAILHHSNICTVFDGGEIEGRPFLSMAFIEGTPLDEVIDARRPMPERQAAELARKIASALAHAHGKGVVHRDLKPANVIVTADGEPVVMDFGLAKLVTESDLHEVNLTKEGSLLGTPSYMAPEQVRCELNRIGPATDVYALGVMLFEMLAGRTPYSGPLGVVMGQILASAVPLVSEFRPGVDPRLVAICRRAMAKDPAERFPNMEALARELEGYLQRSVAGPLAPLPVAPLPAAPLPAAPLPAAPLPAAPLPAASLPAGAAPTASPPVAVPPRVRGGRNERKKPSLLDPDSKAPLLIAGGAAVGVIALITAMVFSGGSTHAPDVAQPQSGAETQGAPNEQTQASVQPGAAGSGEPQEAPAATPSAPGGSSAASAARDTPELVVLQELPTRQHKSSPWVSPDGLQLYWTHKEGEMMRVWTANRKAPGARFENLTELFAGDDLTVSAGGLTMIYVGNRAMGNALHLRSRASEYAAWGTPRKLSEFDGLGFLAGPCLSSSGLTLYAEMFDHQKHGLPWNVYFTRRDLQSPWGRPQRMTITGLPAGTALRFPFVTPDGRYLFGCHSGASNGMVMLTSNDGGKSFGAPVDVPVPGRSILGKFPRYVAATRELFFAGETSGQAPNNLYVIRNFDPAAVVASKARSSASSASSVADSPASSIDGGFTPMFNGRDLTGWTAYGGPQWSWANGRVLATPGGAGFLMTDADYDDFELEFEYRLGPGAGSGLFLRADAGGHISGRSQLEVQILDDAAYAGLPSNSLTGAVYGVFPRTVVPAINQGDWNTMRVRLNQRSLQVWVNGARTVDADLDSARDKFAANPGLTRTTGRIGFQLNQNAPAEFRNVKIKRLN